MILNFGKLFQESSKDKRMKGLVSIPQDSSLWPEEWKKIEFKEYTRFPRVVLPAPEARASLEDAVRSRRSARVWGGRSVSLQEVSNILFFSCGIIEGKQDVEKSRRAQASGGARYPLEIYVLNFKKGDLDERLYHYNVKSHSLEALWPNDLSSKEMFRKMFSYEWASGAGMVIFITGVPLRSVSKYGERGYRYMYLEAGSIAHMISLVSCSQDMSATMIAGTDDVLIEELIDIDGETETLLISILIGSKK